MGKSKQPTYQAPTPIPNKSASDIFGSATQFGQQNMPNAYGARESALGDLSKGNSYYEGFQPTSFEQALGNQYFQNVWPQTEESIKHGLSLSGLDSSPLLAQQLGQAQGNLGVQIGQYLSDQGNTRATNSLNARLGIDPMASIINPYAQLDAQQSNHNTDSQNAYNQAVAQQQYQDAMNKYQQQQAMIKLIGQISPVGGAIYGGITGGSQGVGTSLGGSFDTLGSLIQGGSSLGLGNMISSFGLPNMSSSVNPMSLGQQLNSGGYGSMFSPYSMPNSSMNFSSGR